MADTEKRVESLSPSELKSSIDSGEDLSILDVRQPNEYEAWRISQDRLDIVNIPYMRFLEADANNNVDEFIEDLPKADCYVVVCGRGEASEYVAGLLLEEGVDAVNLEEGMYGWAGVYESAEIETGTETTVLQYQRPSSGCLSYMVLNGDEAAVIDPLKAFVDRYIQDSESLGAEITRAVDTHVHADHISGVQKLSDESGAEPVVPAGARKRGSEYEARWVEDGDKIGVGDTSITAVHAPGHTSELTAYLVDNLVFTADAVFTESVGRPDLEEGDEGARNAAEAIYDTFHDVLLGFDDETTVAPGHFGSEDEKSGGVYTTTIGEIKELEISSMSKESFVDHLVSDIPPKPSNYEDIIEINLGEKQVSEEEEFELELGPNNCAVNQVS